MESGLSTKHNPPIVQHEMARQRALVVYKKRYKIPGNKIISHYYIAIYQYYIMK